MHGPLNVKLFLGIKHHSSRRSISAVQLHQTLQFPHHATHPVCFWMSGVKTFHKFLHFHL